MIENVNELHNYGTIHIHKYYNRVRSLEVEKYIVHFHQQSQDHHTAVMNGGEGMPRTSYVGDSHCPRMPWSCSLMTEVCSMLYMGVG